MGQRSEVRRRAAVQNLVCQHGDLELYVLRNPGAHFASVLTKILSQYMHVLTNFSHALLTLDVIPESHPPSASINSCQSSDRTYLPLLANSHYQETTHHCQPMYLMCRCCSYAVGQTTRRHPATSSHIFFPLHLFSPRSCHHLSTAEHRLSMLFFFSQENIFRLFHPQL